MVQFRSERGGAVRPIQEWDVSDLQALVRDGVQESLTLDYKGSASLERSSQRRNEISKDVSAFANSAGGIIVYGIVEEKHVPVAVDNGVDPSEISREWLDQTINSTIQPRISGVIIRPIILESGRVAYAVSIPQAKSGGPHQAHDLKYYRRFNFESVAMHDYEIKDVMKRGSSPELFLSLSATPIGPGDIGPRVRIAGDIGNRSAEPALYSNITLFIDARLAPEKIERMSIRESDFAAVTGGIAEASESAIFPLKGFDRNLSVSAHQPLYRERVFRVFSFETTVPNSDTIFHVGYLLSCPGFSKLTIGRVRREGEKVSIEFDDE